MVRPKKLTAGSASHRANALYGTQSFVAVVNTQPGEPTTHPLTCMFKIHPCLCVSVAYRHRFSVD